MTNSAQPSRRPSHESHHALRWGFLVLVAGLLFTTALARWVWQDALRQDSARFVALVRDSWELIETRVEKYELGLLGVADWFGLIETPSLAQWAGRMERFDLAVNYPGIIEVGYIVHLQGNIDDRWTNRIPAHWQKEWFPESAHFPDLTLYLERPEPGLEVVNRRRSFPREDGEALGVAYRSGEAATSPAVIVGTNAAGPIQGFRMYCAAYQTDEQIYTNRVLLDGPARPGMRPAQRGDALVGWVFGTFAAESFLQNVIGDEPIEVDFEWFGGEPSPTNRLNHAGQPLFALTPEYAQGLHTNLIVPWYGQKWTLAFRPTPAFYQHSERGRVWLVAGTGIALSLSLACLVFVQTRGRARAEAQAEELAEIRELLRDAAEDRARISREIHDGAIQSLYATGLILGRIRRDPGNRETVGWGVQEASEQLDRTIADLRQYLQAHRSDEVDRPRSLALALEDIMRRWRESHTAQFCLHTDTSNFPGLPARVVAELQQIAQEAVSNSLRHGHAQKVTIWLRTVGARFHMEIADDGGGFDPRNSERPGHGLANIRQRAKDLGGCFLLDSQPGGPTTISVEVPL